LWATPLEHRCRPIVYDPATKYFYIVNGGREAKTPYCLISVVDAVSGKKLEDIKLDTNRLESMALEKSSSRLFVNMTTANVIGVVDRKTRALVTTWPVTAGLETCRCSTMNPRIAYLQFTRKPSRLVVVNTERARKSPAFQPQTPSMIWLTILYFTPVCSGWKLGWRSWCVTVVQQKDADHYEVLATYLPNPAPEMRAWSPNSTSTT